MKTRQKHLYWIPAAILIGMFSACGGGGGGGTTPATGGSPTTPSGGGTINGLVTDFDTGARLAGVTVSGGGKTATTDSKGAFTLSGFTGGTTVAVTLDKAGYALGYNNAHIGVNAAPLVLPLKKESAKKAYNTANTTTIVQKTEAGPYAVIFSPNTLDTTETNLTVSVTPLDPTKEANVLPGSLATSTVMLAPLTFAEFSVFDSTGKRVNLKAGSTATVEMPIPPDLRGRAEYALGQTVHCYSYDAATGQWGDFIVGTVVTSSVDGTTPVLRADVKHFSWYGGAPQKGNCVDVYGTVVSAVDGKPLPFARVEAFPGTVTTSDANGNFVVVTTPDGPNSFTATRTYTDTDGSVSGMVGAKVIEFGKVSDDSLLTGLVSRPCVNGKAAAPSVWKSLFSRASTPNMVIKVGSVGLLSYQVNAMLMSGMVTAQINEALPDGNQGAEVRGAVITIKGPAGEVALTEVPSTPGSYYAMLPSFTPGARYTLNIDADHNGSIDGTGSVNAVGTLTWSNSLNGSTSAASAFNSAAWTDSGSTVSGYSVVYFASIVNSGSTAMAIYNGSATQFIPLNLLGSGNLPAGSYTANIVGFSGPFNATTPRPEDAWTPTNNISGSTVSGKFISFGSSIATFTLN